jgi:hypothetical protein
MPIQLQPRDVSFLSELGAVGLMTSEQIFQRHYSPLDRIVTKVTCNRRLRDMANEGFLARKDLVLSANKGIKKENSVFQLTSEGVEEVYQRTGVEIVNARVHRKFPSDQTVRHRVGVSTTLLAFKDAAKKENLSTPEWLLEWDMEPTAKPNQPLDKQLIIYESFVIGRDRFSCRPDASVAIELPSKHTLLGYIEYDRSTETLGQIQRTKLNGYSLMLGSKSYLQHWPNKPKPVARVLFVCKSRDRIRNLQDCLSSTELKKEYSFTLHEYLNENVLSAPVWWKLDDDVEKPGISILHGRNGPSNA